MLPCLTCLNVQQAFFLRVQSLCALWGTLFSGMLPCLTFPFGGHCCLGYRIIAFNRLTWRGRSLLPYPQYALLRAACLSKASHPASHVSIRPRFSLNMPVLYQLSPEIVCLGSVRDLTIFEPCLRSWRSLCCFHRS